MKLDYAAFSRFSAGDRRDAFALAAQQHGTQAQNVEKDFWICAVLDTLFQNTPSKGWPKLAFRGGTSLSKAFGHIKRFSEDIDIAISRRSLGEDISLKALERLSPDARQMRITKIESKGAAFVDMTARPIIADCFERLGEDGSKVSLDPRDPLTLRAPYRSVVARGTDYVLPTVRIEFSVRAALKPIETRTIWPYVALENTRVNFDMDVRGVRTIHASRTFWDKVLIAHEINQRHVQDKPKPDENERVTRHYYDLWRMLSDGVVQLNGAQVRRLEDCRLHSQLFYGEHGIDLSQAALGTLNIVPNKNLWPKLKRDYRQMQVMTFEPMPDFESLMAELQVHEERLNAFDVSKVRSV